jgi:DNA ligase-1
MENFDIDCMNLSDYKDMGSEWYSDDMIYGSPSKLEIEKQKNFLKHLMGYFRNEDIADNSIDRVLYKKDSKGVIREWQMEREAYITRTITGIKGGKKITSEWTIHPEVNIGKSNYKSNLAVAEEYRLAAYKQKIEQDHYVETLSDIDKENEYFDPMLCSQYEPGMNIPVPFSIQPKLDGIRCIAKADGLWTRNGKRIVSCPHIMEELKPFFAKAPWLILDGELYNHDYKNDFNTITSLTKKLKPTTKDLKNSSDVIEYHIYDSPSFSGGFEKRFESFRNFNKHKFKMIKLVETLTIVTPPEDISYLMDSYIEEGYEGMVIRLHGHTYEPGKRSKYLIKNKPLYNGGGEEGEFIINDIEEGNGNWSGKAKAVRLYPNTNTNPSIIQYNRTFKATLKGTMEYCEKVLKDKNKYIGKKATVVYQNKTPDGIPRFATIKELDRQDI